MSSVYETLEKIQSYCTVAEVDELELEALKELRVLASELNRNCGFEISLILEKDAGDSE